LRQRVTDSSLRCLLALAVLLLLLELHKLHLLLLLSLILSLKLTLRLDEVGKRAHVETGHHSSLHREAV
jgi:hypothetical protein